MSKCYFISDLHLNHKWMAQHRKFQDEFYHDEHIIDSWNSRVTKRDKVYILGDLSMHDPSQYKQLDRLLGRKILIAGNHDSGKGWLREVSKYVDEIYGVTRYSSKTYGGILLSHMPIHPLEFKYNFNKIKYNIHGHIHAAYEIDDPRYINVSAEVIDYMPRSLEELIINL